MDLNIKTSKGNYLVDRVFYGGKSGDKIMSIKNKNGKLSVLKLSKNYDNFMKEIYNTKKIFKIFRTISKTRYNPIVKIENFGTNLEYENSLYNYYIMEYLDPKDWTELTDIILDFCKNPNIDKTSMKNLFFNIFEVLKTFKLNGISHCDLHTRNIFVNKKTDKIKIIDFGLGETSRNQCKKRRSITKGILDNYSMCQKSTMNLYIKLIKGELFPKNIDSDMAMFVSILGIFFNDNKFAIEQLGEISQKIFLWLPKDRNIVEDYMDIFEDILKKLFEKEEMKKRQKKSVKVSGFSKMRTVSGIPKK